MNGDGAGGTPGGSDGGGGGGASDGGDGGLSLPSPCLLPHTFCDDFDGPPLEEKWDTVRTTGGDVTVDSSEFLSAPRALRIRLKSGSGTREALVSNDIAVTNTEKVVELAFDFKLDRAAGSFEEIDYGAVIAEPPPGTLRSHGLTIADSDWRDCTSSTFESPRAEASTLMRCRLCSRTASGFTS